MRGDDGVSLRPKSKFKKQIHPACLRIHTELLGRWIGDEKQPTIDLCVAREKTDGVVQHVIKSNGICNCLLARSLVGAKDG